MIGSAVPRAGCANTEMPGKNSKVSTHMRTIRVRFMRSYGASTRFGFSVSILPEQGAATFRSSWNSQHRCGCERWFFNIHTIHRDQRKGTEPGSRLNQFAKPIRNRVLVQFTKWHGRPARENHAQDARATSNEPTLETEQLRY